MIEVVDIGRALAGRSRLEGRGPHTTEAEAAAAFATLARFGDGAIFAGGFSGRSPWERHRGGDELVHVLEGAATLTVIEDDEPVSVALHAGSLVVVPRGRWHRFHAPTGVTLLTATPQPTDHSSAEDPRAAG